MAEITFATAINCIDGRTHLPVPPKEILETYDAGKAKDLFTQFVRNKTWQVPTLSVLRAISLGNDKSFTTNIRTDFMPAFFEKDWEKLTSNIERMKKMRRGSDFIRRNLTSCKQCTNQVLIS